VSECGLGPWPHAVGSPSMLADHGRPSFHGLIILHARTGQQIHCTRLSPAFGLTTCELGACSPSRPPCRTTSLTCACLSSRGIAARDDLRLGAMLYVLYLNGANVLAADFSSPAATGLRLYAIGDVLVHFCEDAARHALLIMFVDAAVGEAGGAFLTSTFLRHIDRAVATRADAAAAGVAETALRPREPSAKGAFKRQAVAAALGAALGALSEWSFTQMVGATTCCPGSNRASMSGALQLVGLAALCSAAACDALAPWAAAVGGDCGTHADALTTAWDERTDALLARLLGVEPTGSCDASLSVSSPPLERRHERRGSCVGCWRSRTTLKGTARRPAPHPRASPVLPAPPPLFWQEVASSTPGESDSDGTAVCSSSSSSSSSSSGGHSSGEGRAGVCLDGMSSRQGRRLLDELQAALRHRSLSVAQAWWSAPETAPEVGSPTSGAPETAPAVGSQTSGAPKTAPEVGSPTRGAPHAATRRCVVVLVRPPLVLRARVVWHASEVGEFEAAVAALAAKLQPLLGPLSLGLDAMHVSRMVSPQP